MVDVMTITNTHSTNTRAEAKLRRSILKTMARRSFCILASTSAAGRAHSAGVIYQWVDGALWIHSTRGSRKVRNIASNRSVGVAIPYRRLPAGPPFTIHFQGVAEVTAMDAPEAVALIEAGRIDSISGHGALEMDDGCFVVIRPTGAIHSYGPAARVIDLVRDPLHHGFHSFELGEGER